MHILQKMRMGGLIVKLCDIVSLLIEVYSYIKPVCFPVVLIVKLCDILSLLIEVYSYPFVFL